MKEYKSHRSGEKKAPLTEVSVKIVYDNTACDNNYQFGWGFSCLVDNRILFDTGEAPKPLFYNLNQLNVEPEQIEAVVISHDHWDHTGGLWDLLKRNRGLTVYACPGFGDEFKKTVTALEGKLVTSSGFRKIEPMITVTGEIPGEYKGMPMPEQALVLESDDELTMFTGCSHPGIIHMLEIVQCQYHNKPFSLVLGGFHLMSTTRKEVQDIAARMQDMGVRSVGPTHCTGDEAIKIFKNLYKEQYVPVHAGTQFKVHAA
ncbi:MBL fold metallo-hydrolase [bacterium]|nr:MBL fold metallo-hydrolase [bacterium]